MRARRSAPAVLLTAAIVALVVSTVGLIASIMLNAFVFDEYDAYGEVPIPGAAALHLPAGDVNVTLHTYAVGSPGGGGLPIPDLSMTIEPPSGVARPEVVESIGSTTSVNNDIRRRVWVAHIPAEGTYRVRTDGKVGAFIEPRLAFGHGSTSGWVPWAFAAVMAVSVLDLVVAIAWLRRRRRVPAGPRFAAPTATPTTMPTGMTTEQMTTGMTTGTPTAGSAGSYEPSDEGIRIRQLENLAALRDSGALTQREFEQEKRRILEGR